MSAVNIPDAKNFLKPEQVTIQNLLIENGQLIETVAEYQRMGRIVDATKYQERLHTNLIHLAKMADSASSSQLLQEISGASPQTQSSPPAIEHLSNVASAVVNPQNVAVMPMTNANVPHQQQGSTPLAVPIANSASPPNIHAQQYGNSTTPPAHAVQYQFPPTTHSSPNVQAVQQQQPPSSAAHYYPQQPTASFQRNLNVPPHSMPFQHQPNGQLSQQQQMSAQNSVVYAGQHHQHYPTYPLLQQQHQPSHPFSPSIQSQFPPSTCAAYVPMAVPAQSDSVSLGVRQQQIVYQPASHGNHQVSQHGTSPGGHATQQK